MTSAPPSAVHVVVVDFDGTICEQDVSEEIMRRFADPSWWDIDLEFRRGEIGSRECLDRQAGLLEGSTSELLRFALSTFAIDPTFPSFVEWARGVGIAVEVASDGLGFYVEPMLRAGGVEGLPILTNRFDLDGGARLEFPNRHPECVGCGACKMLAVRWARERFGPVAFVGEGHSDRYGALYADVVFAKKHLVEICRSDGVAFFPWESFDDVRVGLDGLRELPAPVGPERCPGWKRLAASP